MKVFGFMRMAGLVLLLFGALLLSPAAARGQTEPDLQAQADALFQQMTIPERIGQLFLVTFEGDRAPRNSDVAEMILNYHIGGVALLSANDNLTGYGDPADTPR